MVREILTEISENKFKLDVGSMNLDLLESTLATKRDYEEFDIWLEIKSDNDVQKLKELYQQHGASVKTLNWCNWTNFDIAASDIVELLNSLPNLTTLKFSSWQKEFTGSVNAGCLKLPNLSSLEISECQLFIFDFLTTALPENVVKSLKVHGINDVDEKFSAFISKQKSVKRLNINGDFFTLEPLTSLKLESLRVILFRKDEDDSQLEFIRALIASQSELTELDLLNEAAYSFSFVNDDILAAVGKLSKLEKFSFNIDDVTSKGIAIFSSLCALKSLQVKTNRDRSLGLFNELSSQKNSTLETLVLDLWTFEIPAETYSQFGANYENLKSLTITLGTWHSVNFFAKAFPNLESLNVSFGEANQRVEFAQAYDASSEIANSNLKSLRLKFWGGEEIDSEKFFKMIAGFSQLESLQIQSKFAFTAAFIAQFAEKLASIKALKLSTFSIHNNEKFPAEIIEALKNLRSKLDFVSITLANMQVVNFGSGIQQGEDAEDDSFSFQPLIDGLQGIYRDKSGSFANIRIHNNLELIAGCEKNELNA